MKLPVPRNVGSLDRVARVSLGGVTASVPIILGVGLPIIVGGAVLGGGIAMSGLMGRCSIYYMLGVSTLGSPSR